MVDLENALMAQLAIAEAAVIEIPDQKWSERPLVCIVVEPGQDAPVADALDGHPIRLGLAHWQVPDRFDLIDAVPRTQTGKFWKRTLRLRVLPRRLVVERIYNFDLPTLMAEFATQVSKWGNSLAIRLPAAVVQVLGLKEGDQVDFFVAGDDKFLVGRTPSNREVLARLREYRGRLPADFKFDRLEANVDRG